ncbi:hypothetical protein AKJ16_DCAP07213 [Drosera capensis]
MAPPPAGPCSGVSQLALVARASVFAFGLAYGNIKLKFLKIPVALLSAIHKQHDTRFATEK